MIWEGSRDLSWEKNFAAAKEYYDTCGNLNMTAAYESPSGLRTGAWIAGLRTLRKNGARRKYLTPERIRALDEIGMIWDVSDFLWHRCYGACVDYYQHHGDLDVPPDEVTPDGIRLGSWIYSIRAAKDRLDDDKIRALDEIGMLWDRKNDRLWERGYNAALDYLREHGDLDVPASYKSADGYRLGAWICDQREKKNMPERRKKRLDDIGMIWKKPDPWEVRYSLARGYYEEHGDLKIPPDLKLDGIWMYKWLSEQRQIRLGNRGKKQLTKEQVDKLNSIGMIWESRKGGRGDV